jgi:glycine/D-amino acid oxidase-like deaminating enzyme
MREVDCLIVGLGIAGIAACEEWLSKGKRIMVIDKGEATATEVAGGVVNPVVLKRFNAVWRAKEFMPKAVETYTNISNRLGNSIAKTIDIYRILNSIEEQNNWTVASDRNELRPYLSSNIVENKNKSIKAPYGLGKVTGALQLFPSLLLSQYRDYLEQRGSLLRERFHYEALQFTSEGISYGSVRAKCIWFCEGISALKNPFIPTGALIPNKGEYAILKAPALETESVLKGSMFVIPLGNGSYKVGATFSRDATSMETTKDAAERISESFQKMISSSGTLVAQVAGVRPTTKDRRPILGRCVGQRHAYVLNGLGSRGLLMAPLLAQWLYECTQQGTPIPPEVDVSRCNA